MTIPIRFDKGDGDGTVEQLEGDRVLIDASRASAPGSRLAVTLQPDGHLLVKVRRCVRNGDRFTIEGRFVNLTRSMRNELQERLKDGKTESIERCPSD